MYSLPLSKIKKGNFMHLFWLDIFKNSNEIILRENNFKFVFSHGAWKFTAWFSYRFIDEGEFNNHEIESSLILYFVLFLYIKS